MEQRKLGSSGIEVSVLAVGCWGFAGGSQWGRQDDRDSIAAVHAALDLGVNFFDTAPGYGDGSSERILGRALAGRHERAVVATKVGREAAGRDDVVASCDRSLANLKTDVIDLLQVHWPNRDVPFEETAGALLELKRRGKVRAVGVCNFGAEDVAAWFAAGGDMAANQLSYSLLWRAIEFAVVPGCLSRGAGILAYSPLVHGLLSGGYRSADEFPPGRARTRHFAGSRGGRHGQPGHEALTFAALEAIRKVCAELGQPMSRVALAWLLRRPGVVSVLAGARNAGQVKLNAASADLALDDAVVARLDACTEALKRALGPDPDMWEHPGRSR